MHSSTAVILKMLLVLLLLYLLPTLAHCQGDGFHKCMQVSTSGYSYDSLFKLHLDSDSSVTINFHVQTSSDAHIMFTSDTEILDSLSAIKTRNPFVEIVIGGGRDHFSAIRSGNRDTKTTKISSPTNDLLSPTEYRGFWIKVGRMVKVGKENETEPFLATDPFPYGPSFKPIYFGFSSWNNVKAKWKINCPDEPSTVVNSYEIENITMNSLDRLRWDLGTLYDPSTIPAVEMDEDSELSVYPNILPIGMRMQVHHFDMNEHEYSFNMMGKFILTWQDNRLKWNSSLYEGIESFLAPSSSVWTPNICLMHGRYGNYDILRPSKSFVFINSNGTLTWTPLFELSAFLSNHLKSEWPQDNFKFGLIFLTASLTEMIESTSFDYGKLVSYDDNPLEILSKSSNWNLNKVSFDDNKKLNDILDGIVLPIFVVTLEVERKSKTILSIFIPPLAVIAAMSLVTFWFSKSTNIRLCLHCTSAILEVLFIINMAGRIPSYTAEAPLLLRAYNISLLLSTFNIIYVVSSKHLIKGTWPISHNVRKILTDPFFKTFFFIKSFENANSGNDYSQDWKIIAGAIDHTVNLLNWAVYIFVYASIFRVYELI